MASLFNYSLLPLLAFCLTLVPVEVGGNGPVLRRQKREWFMAPRQLLENHDYTGQNIARIRSDKENSTLIKYYLSGPGVDKTPENVFGVDINTGFVRVFTILDREEISFYQLKGIATYADGTYAEKVLDINITVVDENDCTPVIKAQQVGSVNESSASGTMVMKVIATDDDAENTLYSKIRYSIVEQSNMAGMFYINSQTGEVFVQKSILDREEIDTYKLVIQASDLDGRPEGNTGIGEIEIKILDINDNVPTLEKDSYEGSVVENTINVEVMRIKALDRDLIHTDNWLAVFKIISGNEAGYFSITTDSKTNEGVIMIRKALDYEELKELNLEVTVSNKAEYNFGSGSTGGVITQKSYPVKIKVVNQMEGPRFQPSVKVVTISEDHTSINLNKIITTYAAIDTDTLQTVTNVRYAKIKDDDNWLIIDERTADIRLNKLPDRESTFLVNGTYYAEIICITNEVRAKTATGTIAIQVEDFNDHCPTLTTTTKTMCHWENFIYVTAVDKDEFPNSSPFDFSVIKGSGKQQWDVEPLNDTTVILRSHTSLWRGFYKVAMVIKDQQGKSCDVQVMEVNVCTCHEDSKTCVPRSASSTSFGASGILFLLLGLLLLLLVPLLLLFCLCGGAAMTGDFKPIPFDTKQQLISYHTEGQGEDKDIPLLHTPVEVAGGKIGTQEVPSYGGKGYLKELVDVDGEVVEGGAIRTSTSDVSMFKQYKKYAHPIRQMEMGQMGGEMMMGQRRRYSQYRSGIFDGMALSDEFLDEYYSNKSNFAAQQSQQKDGLLVFDYEGQESPTGSVGCCSLLENDDDLTFLNDLGPKFKTLAEICQGSALITESVSAGISSTPVSQSVRPSTSTHTHIHTHRETIRDRDQVDFNPLNVSSVVSGSSTIIQDKRISERTQGSVTAPKVHIQDKIVLPTQTVLVQQPTMYYAATPMYVVEPKPQVVLVAGGTQQAVGQVGVSQGLVQMGGLQGPQGVVLIDSQVGGLTGKVTQGRTQGTSTRSRQVLVENGSSGGQQVAHLSQSFVQMQGGSTEQGLDVRSHDRQVKVSGFSMGSRGSAGSDEDYAPTATPRTQGSQRVVVQHKKVSQVTERKIESSTRE